MPLFENISCPVCNRAFEEGDDIVYCPDCGTPHHRECYNAVGHCVNRGLHASGYSFYDEINQRTKAREDEEKEKVQSVLRQFRVDEENAEETFAPFFTSEQINTAIYDKDEQKINGESVADYAITIRTNVNRFINIFKEFEYKGRKTSWNWSAFLFGSLYLFFRKMYKHAVLFHFAFISVVYASCFAMMKLSPNYIEAAKNFGNLYAQNKLTYEDMVALSNIPDASKASMIMYISIGAIIVLRVILGLFADRFYKTTISELIKGVNKQIKDGASFVQTSLLQNQSGEMDQEQMRKYYLSRRGGTSVFLPAMAAFAAYMLVSLAYYNIFY